MGFFELMIAVAVGVFVGGAALFCCLAIYNGHAAEKAHMDAWDRTRR